MADAHNGIAFVYYRLKQYEQARKHIKIASQLGADVPKELSEAIEEKTR
ncbi:MAG: hypothetical protein NTW55_00475 [Planctomycetota bacterium]|nr:hypothetical protein [Planctomycetota bacterium]